jgi:hypothetical protein
VIIFAFLYWTMMAHKLHFFPFSRQTFLFPEQSPLCCKELGWLIG